MQMPEHVCDLATEGSQTITNLPTLIFLDLYKFNSVSITASNHLCFLESLVNMEKANTYSLKLVKASAQSDFPWSNTERGVAKDEVKERIHDKYSKTPTKENTKPQEFKLHTEQRAYKRAMFNYSVATKLYIMELQKKQRERIQKIIEEEEIRMLRKEMIPRAQLMPFFDRPFFPQRSNRPLTIPREPSFHMLNSKC